MITPPTLLAEVAAGTILTPAIVAVGTWLEAKATRVLVLQGGTGAGKSLAAAWGSAFVAHRTRMPPAWFDAQILASLAEWKQEAEWNAFDRAPLVVLDDVGEEDKPQRMAVILERLFNVSTGRAIITTNLSDEQAFALYRHRVESRLRGGATWVVLADSDYRLTAPEGRQAPLPTAETRGEVAAKRRAAEERARQEAADEAEAAESLRLGREAHAELLKLTAKFTGEQREQDDASDNERRRVLQQQLEVRRKAAAE